MNASGPVAWYEALMALPACRQTVSGMLDLGQSMGLFGPAGSRRAQPAIALCAGLVATLSDGDVEAAAPWLRELERNLDFLGPGIRAWHRWLVVWDALLRGDVARAASHQPEMLRLAREAGRPMDEAVAHLLSASVMHARAQPQEARGHLDHALEIARVISSPFVEFMARLIEAQQCLHHDREPEAIAALRRAMALGRERGYVTSFVWMPAVMARLCARALAEGIEVEYVRGVVQRRGLVPDVPPLQVESWPWAIKIFTLGRFEVRRDDVPLRFGRKVQRKPLALLKTLIALGGHAVREDLVMDALWPEASGDAARVAMASALHRLRGLLGLEAAIVRQDSQLSLDARTMPLTPCWAASRSDRPRSPEASPHWLPTASSWT